MTAIEWYYARGNKQHGPVNSAELKRLATAGELVPDDLVWREGLTEWAPARSVRGLFEPETKPAAEESPAKPVATAANEVEPPIVSHAAKRHPVESLLDWLRSRFDARFVETTAKVFRACGLYGLLVAVAVVVAFTLIVALKTKSMSGVSSGVVLALLLAALQFVAGKFCDVLERLNQSTSSTLLSNVLPNCVALLSLVAGLAVLLGSVTTAVHTSMYAMILPGIAGFLICGYLAFSALNLSTLNVSVAAEARRASEEAIDILAFFLKLLLRLVPVVLGTGVIAGTLIAGYACYQAMSGDEGLMVAQISFSAASSLLLLSATLPLAVYLSFLLYSLFLDLCRAILGLWKRPETPAAKDDEKDLQHPQGA
jgi:hypothetical protein